MPGFWICLGSRYVRFTHGSKYATIIWLHKSIIIIIFIIIIIIIIIIIVFIFFVIIFSGSLLFAMSYFNVPTLSKVIYK